MEDEVKDFQKQERSGNFLSRISAVHIILFGILVFVLIAISKSAKDSRYTYVGWGILIVIILVLYFKPTKKRQIIPEPMAKKIAYRALQKKRQEGIEISFDSKVNVLPQWQRRWRYDEISGEDTCVALDIGFEELVHGSSYRKEGVVSLDPYSGDMSGLSWFPLGYSGREKTTIIRVVPVQVIEDRKKAADFKAG